MPIQSNTYFPDKNNWLSRKPEELGMDSGILEEAISIAKEDAVPDYLVLCQVCYLTRKALAFLIHHDFDDKRSVFFSAKASPLVSGYKPDTTPEKKSSSLVLGYKPETTPEN